MRPLLLLSLAACAPASVRDSATGAELSDALRAWCPADAAAVEAWADATLAAMTLEEKVAQMSGDQIAPNADGRWDTLDDVAHDVGAFRMIDGPRGASAQSGEATAFPVAMARGATWDVALEAEVGAAIGREVKAVGANMLLAPTVNVLRHPRWGRAQETYGEDPVHLGAMGAAFVEGAQTELMAQVKHYAVNSIEDTRFSVNVLVDDAPLHEVYLPHFRTILRDARPAAVMAAYNHVNGPPASESPELLTDILREQWDYPGVVVSDWVFATETTDGAALAGLDVEMPYGKVYGASLVAAVGDGSVPEGVVDAAVRRILRVKGCFGLDEVGPAVLDPSLCLTDDHLTLAQRVAERGAVLLRNDGVLPLAATATVVVTGRLADVENIGDVGSSAVDPPDVVTAWEGLRDEAGARTVSLVPPGDLASAPLAEADAVIVVVGLTADDEGEGLVAAGDRATLALHPEDVAAIEAAAAGSDRVVVVVEGGSAVTMDGWLDDTAAVLMAWYPGMRGGTAIARLLYGDVTPTGRLPSVFPVAEADLPPFDNTSAEVRYDAFHGYRHLDRTGTAPLFGLGYGLSYTTFAYGEPAVAAAGEGAAAGGATVSISVTNTGARDGVETVFVFASPPTPDPDRPARALAGFGQVALAAGQTATATVAIHPDRWQVYDGGWIVRTGTWTLTVARSSEQPLASLPFAVE